MLVLVLVLVVKMTIKFILLVNKQGQTRLAKYTDEFLSVDERTMLEGEIVRKCLSRSEKQCSIIQHRNYKVIYRRYASLFFLVGVDDEEVRGQNLHFKKGRKETHTHTLSFFLLV